MHPLSMHLAQWYFFWEQVLLLRHGSQEEERLQKVLFPTLKSKHPGKNRKAESDRDSIAVTKRKRWAMAEGMTFVKHWGL